MRRVTLCNSTSMWKSACAVCFSSARGLVWRLVGLSLGVVRFFEALGLVACAARFVIRGWCMLRPEVHLVSRVREIRLHGLNGVLLSAGRFRRPVPSRIYQCPSIIVRSPARCGSGWCRWRHRGRPPPPAWERCGGHQDRRTGDDAVPVAGVAERSALNQPEGARQSLYAQTSVSKAQGQGSDRSWPTNATGLARVTASAARCARFKSLLARQRDGSLA